MDLRIARVLLHMKHDVALVLAVLCPVATFSKYSLASFYHLFDGIFPADNVITAVQKSYGVHKIHMREVAAWVLNGTHWFSLLQQPMMIIVWCHNWEDASKFQYLMQILQAHFHDFVPRWQIFMYDDSKVYGSVPRWQEPTTIWDGKPALGFMAETFLADLSEIGFIVRGLFFGKFRGAFALHDSNPYPNRICMVRFWPLSCHLHPNVSAPFDYTPCACHQNMFCSIAAWQYFCVQF